jgi:hypothetical protein
MNERIRELYIQTANETADGKEWSIGGMENAQHFAELIILECAEMFEGVYTDTHPSERIDTRIKKDFGVE